MPKKILFIIFFIPVFLSAQDLSNLKNQKAFVINGSLQTLLNYQTSSINMDSYQPFSYMVSLNLTPVFYNFSIPLTLTYSERNTAFSNPFYRFGISPTYKWAKLNLGYRSTKFSKYTVSGLKYLGAGIELNPKKFHLAFTYGKFARQRNFRTVYPNDDLNNDEYSRKGFAAKIGVGSKRNYTDLIVMKIADNPGEFADTLKINPEANTVVALDMQFYLTKTTRFKAEVAGSVLTQNMNGMPIDKSDLSGILQKLSDFADVNTSTYLATARDIRLEQKIKSFKIGLQYKRVDPGYRSLGTFAIRNDYETYTLNLGYNTRKISVNTGIGKARDNLKNQKTAQTNRWITRFNIAYRPSKIFNIQANYNNFSTQQTEGRVPLNDTIKIYQANKTISIVPQLRFINKKRVHLIMLNYTYSDMTDKNPFTNNAVPVQSNVAFAQYSYQNLTGKYGASLNITYSEMKSALTEITAMGPNLNFQKTLLNNKINLMAGAGYLSTLANEVKAGVVRGQMQVNYKLSKSQFLRFNFILNKSFSGAAQSYIRDYTRSMLVYGLRF